MQQYHIIINSRQSGPHSELELQQMLREGKITGRELCWKRGMQGWSALHEISDLAGDLPPPPPPSIFAQQTDSTPLNCNTALVLNCLSFGFGVLIGILYYTNEKLAGVLSLLLFPLFITATVFWSILHYRCWKALPQQFRATTPGKAVGYLFIPFFNLYWSFISFPKLIEGLLAWQQSQQRPQSSELVFLAKMYAISNPVVWILGLVPGAYVVIYLIALWLFVDFYPKVVAVINELRANKISGSQEWL